MAVNMARKSSFKYEHRTMKMNFASNFTQNGISARTTWALAFCVMLFGFEALAQPFGGSVAGLNGQWYHNGAPTRILVARDGRSITIINEFNQRNDGFATSNRDLVVRSLRITGRVSKDGRRISWSNGTEWTRERNIPGPAPELNLSGRWLRNGRPTNIQVARDGRNFTITNEWGLRSTGSISRSGELRVPSWRVTGRLSNNGRRISWSNGTEWTRPRLF